MKDDSTDYSAKAIEILEAAEIRIRRGGFEAVSYRDLAADVGIKAASVHYHFPQKALLGAAVVDRYSDRLLATLGRVDLTQTTVEAHLQRLCSCYVAVVQHDEMICLGCMLGAESKDLPDAVSAAARRFFKRLLDWLESVLGDRADAATLAVHIIGTLQGTMILAVTLKRPELMDEVAERLKQLVAV
ncbi:MAG: TetR/AcrR family transcriptional regulator [Lyngbya sp. HA4199-MV5]|jgi:TetR/AcrR family transcriptional repressor of nem operon|nr:TetR/AcrR family transcriptional regulator [Lyngbya sp. HA4199-MV5]